MPASSMSAATAGAGRPAPMAWPAPASICWYRATAGCTWTKARPGAFPCARAMRCSCCATWRSASPTPRIRRRRVACRAARWWRWIPRPRAPAWSAASSRSGQGSATCSSPHCPIIWCCAPAMPTAAPRAPCSNSSWPNAGDRKARLRCCWNGSASCCSSTSCANSAWAWRNSMACSAWPANRSSAACWSG
ncbi:hypothetical protein FQZ97_1055940 [compost metagenome]